MWNRITDYFSGERVAIVNRCNNDPCSKAELLKFSASTLYGARLRRQTDEWRSSRIKPFLARLLTLLAETERAGMALGRSEYLVDCGHGRGRSVLGCLEQDRPTGFKV